MLNLLWLIPLVPLAGFIILAMVGPRHSKVGVAVIGVGSVAISAILALVVGVSFLTAPPPGYTFTQVLGIWMRVGNFSPTFGFTLDPLSLLMIVVITFVAFLIHLYSTRYMIDDDGYRRFFAYMNLFVASMLILVLADNLLFLYLGWEGVGLCSYLLIGFWYKDPANGRAAMKAFIVTRVGDAAMAIALFLLFANLGTLQIQDLMLRAASNWLPGSAIAVAVAALLLGGAVGKSAQLPLQTWLPDAMAGPTPVSALIHAATMVTAGVYLIARTHVLFTLAPIILTIVAIIGVLTLLLAAFSALTQTDFKRILAYSTISQIGYMFLGLGVGAWSAAMFHFMTHAFFKALLFLGAGAVMMSLHDEHSIFRMGGLWRKLPVVFWTFLIGALSLSSFPFITAGFYSKDLIIYDSYASTLGSPWLLAAALLGAFITALYSFRMVFTVFFGEEKTIAKKVTSLLILLPLVVLAIPSMIAGFFELPENLGNIRMVSPFLEHVLPATPIIHGSLSVEFRVQLLSEIASIGGILLAYLLYLRQPAAVSKLATSPVVGAVRRFWKEGWGVDWLYDRLFVRPFLWFTRINKRDFIDAIYLAIAWLTEELNRLFSLTQNGKVRWYAVGMAIGAIILIVIVVWL
ncbi:MAG: NADH-quinone oxidoreductase subunit L [Armatimonadota bacterium]